MSKKKISRVVVMGIWGRAGGDGVPGLVKELKARLVPLGVPKDHVFSASWNPKDNDSFTDDPGTGRHLKALRGVEASPSYLAVIGHSYGGWAACRLSQRLDPTADFVATIDPVFGPLGDAETIVRPRGGNIHNWYQRNSISEPTILEDCTGVVVGCPNGVSCGRKIGRVHNHQVKWQRKWNGKRKTRNCGFDRKPRHAYHLNIDSDRWIWRQIIEQIEADVRTLR